MAMTKLILHMSLCLLSIGTTTGYMGQVCVRSGYQINSGAGDSKVLLKFNTWDKGIKVPTPYYRNNCKCYDAEFPSKWLSGKVYVELINEGDEDQYKPNLFYFKKPDGSWIQCEFIAEGVIIKEDYWMKHGDSISLPCEAVSSVGQWGTFNSYC